MVGLLGWLGVVLVLGAVALRFVRPELQQWYQGLAVAGLIVTGLYALSQWRDIARSFQGRHVQYGSVAAGSVALVLAILVGVNWIANRRSARWDLTEARQFSLSDQTRKILEGLDRPVGVRVFHDTGMAETYRDRLDEYAHHATGRLSVEYVDANRDPVQAGQYEIQSLPTIVFEYDGRRERTSANDEQSLTNALKKVLEGQAKKVYFIQGHGERDSSASDPSGYSGAASALGGDNFDVATLTLAQEGRIPDDATVVVAAGARADYLPGEIDAINAYLAQGGKLMLLIDPPDKVESAQPTGLIALARAWNIDVGHNIIIDTSGLGQLIGTGAETPIAMPAPHAITDGFRTLTAFPLARSVTPVEGGAEGRYPQKVLESGPQSWAEADLKGLFATSRPERNLDKGDLNGPVSIAVAVSATASDAPAPASPEAPRVDTRVLVVGDSDFAANRAINIGGNRDLFLNMANWLAQQEDLIAIRPRSPEDRRISLTADQSQRIFWITIFIIPGLLFGTAVWVWWKRR